MNILFSEKGAGVLGVLAHPLSPSPSHQALTFFQKESESKETYSLFRPMRKELCNTEKINQFISPLGRSPCLATFRAGLHATLPASLLPGFSEEFEK